MGTIAVFGDSIAHGLGVAEGRYGQLVADALDADLLAFTGTAKPITESLSELAESDVRPELAIVAHGATEAILRPTDAMLSRMPRRWRRRGWMDPRPYYSSRLRKRVPQMIESALRWRVKNLLVRIDGGSQVLPLAAYEDRLNELLALLRERGAGTIVLGPSGLQDAFFRGSAAQLDEYARVSQAVAYQHGATYVSLAALHQWDDFFSDHFHPNRSGHQRIADFILTAVQNNSTLR